MKIILACMKYDYGVEARGYSYEYYNFYLSLQQLGHEVSLFDYMSLYKAQGKAHMNQALVELVKQERPALVMFSLYTDQFDEASVQELRQYTKTLVFFHDDTWRVDYSYHWLQFFDYFTTADIFKLEEYKKKGLMNVRHFPFGCNEALYKKQDLPKMYDISFVGGWHPYREWLIKQLKKRGYQVFTAGHRWPTGIIEHQEMVRVFNQSKINLNLSNSTSWQLSYLFSSPYAFLHSLRSKKIAEQIKARHFEINGCGAFQLSYDVAGLEAYYHIGKEIEVFKDVNELIAKVQFYLANDEQRESIAAAAYQRTIDDHLFAKRFANTFQQMGLANK